MMLRTVEIIGGGLAGLSLGLGLRSRNIPVRLIEAGSYPRHRVCGEFITALDGPTCSRLQLGELLKPALPGRSVTWLEPGRPAMRHHFPRPALCLSRFHLDAKMAEAFTASGGDLRTQQRCTAEPTEGRVMASGRRPLASSPWIGLKQHFRALPLRDDLEVHLGRGAYVGLTRVEDSLVNVCGLFPRPRAGEASSLTGRIRAAGLTELADRLQAAECVEGTDCAVAGLNYGGKTMARGSIGDHQGLIPPFTGHGMTIALQSASAALEHLEAWSRGTVPWTETTARISRDLHRRFRRRILVGRLIHPWLLDSSRRRLIYALHRLGLFPFGALYRLSH
jgi:flavin-dependent dehydrogenase